MEEKEYPPNCAVSGSHQQLIIVITHEESIFLANNRKRQAWICDGDATLKEKGKRLWYQISFYLFFN